MVDLPPFPTDPHTLDLLHAAVDPWSAGHAEAERSSLYDFLTLMSEMGGSNTSAVDHTTGTVPELRDPQYTPNDVIAALIEEIRRLRGESR